MPVIEWGREKGSEGGKGGEVETDDDEGARSSWIAGEIASSSPPWLAAHVCLCALCLCKDASLRACVLCGLWEKSARRLDPGGE